MAEQNLAKLMITAAKKGNTAAIRELVRHDPGLLDARDSDGSTPLHCAAWKGNAEAVQVLIELGADVDAVSENDHYGTTPLHAAAHGNQAVVVRLLLASGARTDIQNMHGRCAIDETSIHNATAAAKAIREATPPGSTP